MKLMRAHACPESMYHIIYHILQDAQDRVNAGQAPNKSNAASAGNPGFFRKGEVGDWRNYFSAEQASAFDEL